jgi:hypothetical protein
LVLELIKIIIYIGFHDNPPILKKPTGWGNLAGGTVFPDDLTTAGKN